MGDSRPGGRAQAHRPQGHVHSDGSTHIVTSMYQSCSDEEEGVSFTSFCHFLGHLRLFSQLLDHVSITKIFLDCTGGELQVEELLEERRLDQTTFRTALQTVANAVYGAKNGLIEISETPQGATGSRRTSGARRGSQLVGHEATAKMAALQDLLQDAALRNIESAFSPQSIDAMRGALYDMEVVKVVYEHKHALLKLFSHYAGDSGNSSQEQFLNARSAYRFCRATRLVPECVIPGEFHDVAVKLRGNVRAEAKYLQDDKMLQRGEEINLLQPAQNFVHGEPRFSFPQFLELLVAACMHMPPRKYGATPEDRIARIEEIFGELLGIPKGPCETFDAELYLRAASNLGEDVVASTRGPQTAHGVTFATIFEEFDSELPRLGPKQDPHVPQPPRQIVEKLPLQPPTVEERVLEAAKRAASGKAKAGRPKSKKSKGNKQAAVKRLVEGPVHFDQIQWLGKRPVPQPPVVPAMWQTDSLVEQFNRLEDRIIDQRKQAESHDTPCTGPGVLRMQLIDEPLRAPECARNEQVSTLIETALTSRRLRQYDSAIALLIRARSLWAALEAGRVVSPDWADVHPYVKTPSPWLRSESIGSPPSAPRQEHYSPAKVREGRCGTLHSELVLSPEPVEVLAEPVESQLPLSPGDLETTILPSDLVCTSEDTTRRKSSLQIEVEDNNTGQNSAVDPRSPLSPSDRRQRLNAERSARLGKEIASPKSTRGRSTTGRPATHSRATAKRYDPQKDFPLAAGSNEADLEHLPPQVALFFLCELASLHSAIQEDELAARLLWLAHDPVQRLPKHDASAAMVWCGLGRVTFHASHFEMAARFHMKARTIRERLLGGDSIDTATVYNNLACCLVALDRCLEAAAYVELAAEILKELAGEDHPRTQTALRNFEKARSKPKNMSIDVPHLYSLPVKDHRLMYMGKRRKKKKGRSKGSSSGSSKKGGKKK